MYTVYISSRPFRRRYGYKPSLSIRLCVRVLIFITIHISRPVQKRRFWHWIKTWEDQAVVWRPYIQSLQNWNLFLPFSLSLSFLPSTLLLWGNKITTKKKERKRAKGQLYNVNTLTYKYTFQTSRKKREKRSPKRILVLWDSVFFKRGEYYLIFLLLLFFQSIWALFSFHFFKDSSPVSPSQLKFGTIMVTVTVS